MKTMCQYQESFWRKFNDLNNGNKQIENISLVKQGVEYAIKYHGNQKRKSGDPYYSHPLIVAELVMQCKFTADVIIAALLHDTVEDTDLTLEKIETDFNPRIAELVKMLTREVDPITNTKKAFMKNCGYLAAYTKIKMR